MDSTTFALVVLRKLSDIQEDLPMRIRHKEFIGGMESKTETGNRKFFDLRTEYSNVRCTSDDEISDVTSELSFTHRNEDGYSSDISNASSMLRETLDWQDCKKNRKTRQILNSNRNSMVIEYASDTDVPTTEKQQRKKRTKVHRQSKPIAPDYREDITKTANENAEKRRSWTDSGVSLSLSRTDQSRCGTFDNDISVTQKAELAKDLKVTLEKFHKNEETKEVVTCVNNNNLRRRSSNCSRKISDAKRFNRLSQLTNRSSLTNVTILTSNSMTSLSSVMTPSEVEYETASDTSESEEEEYIIKRNLHLSVPRKNEIEKGSQASVASNSTIVNCMMHSRTSIETTIASEQKKDNNFNNNIANTKVITIDKTLNETPKRHPGSPRKRSKSLFSGFKRVKEHLRPRFFSDKNYKDVSSDFSFEKVRNDKETEQLFEEITADVLKKLEKIQQEESEELNKISSTFIEEYDSIDEEDDEEENEILQQLSNRPTKEKTFLGKIFKRSRSYSTTTDKKTKSKQPSPFVRSKPIRASVRSNPEGYSKEVLVHERCTQSLEHLDKNNFGLKYVDECEEYTCSDINCQCDRDITRTKSMTFTSQEPNVHRERANSTPNTPVVMREDRYNFQGLNSIENQCSCEECLYADYLDYIEFQRFRRYANYPPCYDTCCTASDASSYPTHITDNASSSLAVRTSIVKEDIIAPLPVTMETEKKAKTFRTSKYESFV